MKQIKFISAMLLLATLFLGFNACSSDDDKESITDEGKQIIKIVNEYGKNIVRTETFSYSSGKMSKYTAKYDEDTNYENNQIITYSDNIVTMDGLLDDHNCVQTYTLNNNGLASSCQIVYKDNGNIDNYTFQYSDGYLIGMSYNHESHIPQYSSQESYIFQYSNGNMIKATKSYYGSDDNGNTDYTFTYSGDENKGGIINPFIGDLLFEHVAAHYIGILGKSTKNLAMSSVQKYTSSTREDEYNCFYSLNNDGYVKTATASNGEKLTYTFE